MEEISVSGPAPRLGFALTFASLLFWGAQPIAIGAISQAVPGAVLAFWKMLTAAIAIFLWLLARGRIGRGPAWRTEGAALFAAGLCLGLSSSSFNACFRFISPANAQIYFQPSRLFLAIGGLVFFREKFTRAQGAGFVAVLAGLVLFFRDQLTVAGDGYGWGTALAVGAAALWAGYALLQKQASRSLGSLECLLAIYAVASLSLVPFAEVAPLLRLDGAGWVAFGVVCLCNVLAFSCFAEALRVWESTKVAAVSCLTPFATIALAAAASMALGTRAENFGFSAWLGAIFVVAGSVVVTVF